jgi:3-phosphoshikimate 1-carboxyvinyltransferase
VTAVRFDPGVAPRLRGMLRVPSDKSLTQRALLLAARAEGTSVIDQPLRSADTRAVARAITALGAGFEETASSWRVRGTGAAGFTAPRGPLDLCNSGTGARLLFGLLAGRGCSATLTGDASLRSRPMGRIVRPLTAMGARFEGDNPDRLPLRCHVPAGLVPYRGTLEIASAQVKSAILLAALGADGETLLLEVGQSRDHTERMLPAFGGAIHVAEDRITLRGPQELTAAALRIAADPSSAAPLAAAAALRAASRIQLTGLCANPRRTGFFAVLARMGGAVAWGPVDPRGGEPSATLDVKHRRLHGTTVTAGEVPAMIDELPLVAVLACMAEGETRIEGAAELRVKESDRIEVLARGLRAMGAEVHTREDGWTIRGPQRLRAAAVETAGDHRMAMAFVVAALGAGVAIELDDAGVFDVSYPGFLADVAGLLGRPG